MMTIDNPNDLYKIILKENLKIKQVNHILDNFLIQKAFFVFEDYSSEQIVEILKEYFDKYSNVSSKPIFIEHLDFDVKDFINNNNSLIQIDK